MEQLKPCSFCHEDRDGYVDLLPRKGTGRFSIHNLRLSYGWVLSVTGKPGYAAEVFINFCPMCGRRLREELINA